MGLTTPLALLAAALIALPIVAHLVRRADVERRVIPTVALLRRVVVRDRRRARITEPWLLALRIAAVIAAAMALAAPFVVDRLAYGDGSAIAIAIVIDDSQSMAQRDASGRPALEAALARAREVVRSVGEGSEVAIVLAGRPARLVLPRSEDRAAALAALDATRAEARRTDLEGALLLAARQLASARLATRRTLLVSDFAAAELDERVLRGARAAPGAELELISVAAEEPSNVGIAEVHAVRDPLETGALSLTVALLATGPARPASRSVTVVALPLGVGLPPPDAVELTRTVASFEDGRARVTIRFRPPPEVTHVAVRLTADETDALPDDDTRVVSVRPPRATRVVLVEPAASRTGRFAARALAALPPEQGGFLVTTVDVDHLAGARGGTIDPDAEHAPDVLTDADVLVLAGAIPTSPGALAALRAFVDGGGGLLVAPGPATRTIDLAVLAELLPARTSGVETAPATSTISAGPVTLLDPGPTGLETVMTRARLSLEAAPSAVALTYSDGAPFLVLDPTTRRAVLAVALDDSMSDLPVRVGFVPLVLTLARALGRPGILPDRPFVGGEVPALRVGPAVQELEIVTPAGEVRARSAEREVVVLEDLAMAGAYALSARGASGIEALDRAALVIVPPADEIDLTPRVPALGEDAAADASSDGEARVPIDRWLFALLGVLAAIEG